MKKTFSFLLSLLVLLFTSCTFFGKTSGSLSVYIDGAAFYNAMRAADDSFDGEVFTATLTVTGMTPVVQNFTKKTGAVLTIADITADSVVDISLSLSKDNIVLYNGNRKNYVVQTGENAVKIEMTATEEMKTYKNPHITYVTGTENKIEEKIVEKGYVLTEDDLPELKLEGKVFEGWYNGETAVKAGDVINENITLTAKWSEIKQEPVEPEEPVEPIEPEVKKYPITYVTGTEEKIEEKLVEKGYVLTEKDLPELKLEGKVFEGWYNGETAVKAGDVINENTTLTAKWTDVKQEPVEPEEPVEPIEPEVKKYPITYVTGTEEKIEEKIVEKGYVLTEDDLPELKLEGKVFEGWYNGEVAVKAGDVVSENITLTAKWSDIKQEPVEPEEPDEPEEYVYPNVVLTMTMNGSPVAQGGIIYTTDINNSTLAVNYEKSEDAAANLQVIIRMKVGEEEIESSKLYMPVQLNLPSILNGKTLPDGKYSLKVYLIKDEKESENYEAFDFVVKTAGKIDAELLAEVPEFKIICSYDENNDRYEFTLKADNGDDLTGYDFKWTVNGTVLSAKSNYLDVYSNGNTGTEFVYTRFNENNQNNVICEITNPNTGSKQTATLMFGIKK